MKVAPKKKIIFITGGTRNGKSAFALKEASKVSGKKAYIATAEALDEEMRQRIEEHKRQRGDKWITYEEPLKIAEVIKEIEGKYSVIIIDCLTLWLSNLMHTGLSVTETINALIDVLTDVGAGLALPNKKSNISKGGPMPAPTIFIVSNEVGMGIVPDNDLARKFRDMAGFFNQKIAKVADEAYMVIAGIPLKIKGPK
ncbi:MAG: bifunctional adenosylcobinamide kinase/adenosylcobinamide-phosphate guanylyltransferase [Nitrospirae bacterium]|nr:bifunctional adenosylcobinamide kinase/adenosylcobinamide-phosphate guanylyltransferase [Nitrospirota bacterium]